MTAQTVLLCAIGTAAVFLCWVRLAMMMCIVVKVFY